MIGEQATLKRASWITSLRDRQFEAMWQKHRPRIWRLTARLAGNADLADDLTQDVAMRACESYSGFRGSASIYSWLYRIAVNVVLRHRERKLHPTDSLDNSITANLATYDAGPHAVAVERELRSRIWQALEALPEDQRTVLILQVYEELKYREIAEVLEIPIGTVKSRLNSAVARLRKELNSDEM